MAAAVPGCLACNGGVFDEGAMFDRHVVGPIHFFYVHTGRDLEAQQSNAGDDQSLNQSAEAGEGQACHCENGQPGGRCWPGGEKRAGSHCGEGVEECTSSGCMDRAGHHVPQISTEREADGSRVKCASYATSPAETPQTRCLLARRVDRVPVLPGCCRQGKALHMRRA